MNEFACNVECQYLGKPWPKHLPVPTCRLLTEYQHIENPVTKASYRQAIKNRMAYAYECQKQHWSQTQPSLKP